jgi:hypothetical protein
MTPEMPLRATQSAETGSADVSYTEDDARIAVAAMSEAFRAYTGTEPGQTMWNVDMEKTWDIVAPSVLAALAAAGRLLPEDTRTARELPPGSVVAHDQKVWIKRWSRMDGDWWIATETYAVQMPNHVIDDLLRNGARVLRVGSWVPVPEAPYSAAAIDVEAAIDRRPCGECGPGYWIGDEGCRHGVPVPTEPAPLCSACAGAGWPDGIHACPACGGSGEEKPPNE